METGRPTIPKALPRTLAVTCVDGSPRLVECSPTTVKAAVASLWAAAVLRAATGSLVDTFERIPELLRLFSADAGDGESRSGSTCVAIP